MKTFVFLLASIIAVQATASRNSTLAEVEVGCSFGDEDVEWIADTFATDGNYADKNTLNSFAHRPTTCYDIDWIKMVDNGMVIAKRLTAKQFIRSGLIPSSLAAQIMAITNALLEHMNASVFSLKGAISHIKSAARNVGRFVAAAKGAFRSAGQASAVGQRNVKLSMSVLTDLLTGNNYDWTRILNNKSLRKTVRVAGRGCTAWKSFVSTPVKAVCKGYEAVRKAAADIYQAITLTVPVTASDQEFFTSIGGLPTSSGLADPFFTEVSIQTVMAFYCEGYSYSVMEYCKVIPEKYGGSLQPNSKILAEEAAALAEAPGSGSGSFNKCGQTPEEEYYDMYWWENPQVWKHFNPAQSLPGDWLDENQLSTMSEAQLANYGLDFNPSEYTMGLNRITVKNNCIDAKEDYWGLRDYPSPFSFATFPWGYFKQRWESSHQHEETDPAVHDFIANDPAHQIDVSSLDESRFNGF